MRGGDKKRPNNRKRSRRKSLFNKFAVLRFLSKFLMQSLLKSDSLLYMLHSIIKTHYTLHRHLCLLEIMLLLLIAFFVILNSRLFVVCILHEFKKLI